MINSEKCDKLLDEYYQVRGWDSMGIPAASTLSALGLEDIAKEVRIKGSIEKEFICIDKLSRWHYIIVPIYELIVKTILFGVSGKNE